MNAPLELISGIFLASGLLFFVTGSVGLLRFPDIFCRLHAVTKADTLGLGLVTLGLICRADSLHTGLLLLFIWLVVMASAATACQLLARYSQEQHTPASVQQVEKHD